METIEVVIGRDGSLSYVIKGVKGPGCKGLARPIDALGSVAREGNTLEYTACPAQVQQRQKA